VSSASSRRPRLIIVTGLSGSGKSVALRTLEDQEFFCIDNLPVALLPRFADMMLKPEQIPHQQTAVGIDIRNTSEDLAQLPQVLDSLRSSRDIDCEVFFLQADDEVILQRYSETRRVHPLTQGEHRGLSQAIREERRQLEPIASIADLFVDSSHTNVHQLRRLILKRITAGAGAMTVLIESFAYKHGVPADIDIAFDARCLPNPHWDPGLRSFSGRDLPVQEFLQAQPVARELLQDLCDFLDKWLPRFALEDRSYVTVGIGCTGGRHRSVYLAECVARHLREQAMEVLLHHRELGEDDNPW